MTHSLEQLEERLDDLELKAESAAGEAGNASASAQEAKEENKRLRIGSKQLFGEVERIDGRFEEILARVSRLEDESCSPPHSS